LVSILAVVKARANRRPAVAACHHMINRARELNPNASGHKPQCCRSGPGVVLDFNEANEVVGIEILNLPKRTSREIGEGVQLQGLVPDQLAATTTGLQKP